MLSDTLKDGLEKYEIGEKLRQLRLKKKIGLVELGRHTGLSPAMLSKIERGRLYPTLPTLLRIALAFCVGLEYFFEPRTRKALSVVRTDDAIEFEEKLNGPAPAFTFKCLDFNAVSRKLNSYHAKFPSVDPKFVRTHLHDGAEFIFVLSGNLGVMIDGVETVLGKGDAMYFDSDIAHGYRAADNHECSAVVVTVP